MKKLTQLLVLLGVVSLFMLPTLNVNATHDLPEVPVCEFNEKGEVINDPCVYAFAPFNHISMPD